jgi:hypothetical protein
VGHFWHHFWQISHSGVLDAAALRITMACAAAFGL